MSCLKFVRPLRRLITRASPLNLISKRFKYDDCVKDDNVPNCTTRIISKYPCKPSRPEPEQAVQYGFKRSPSMWERPRCCVICNPSKAPMRHDLDYIDFLETKRSSYQRTWYQCPKRVLTKKQCRKIKFKCAEPELRPRGVGNPDAKWITKLSECAKITKYMKPCKRRCKKKRRCIAAVPACCQKRCTLYPSYSECCKRMRPPIPPNECGCLHIFGLCGVNEYLHERSYLNKTKKR